MTITQDLDVSPNLDWDATCEFCEEDVVKVAMRLCCDCTHMRCETCYRVYVAGLHLWESLFSHKEWTDERCGKTVDLKTGPVVPQIIVQEVWL